MLLHDRECTWKANAGSLYGEVGRSSLLMTLELPAEVRAHGLSEL